MICPHCGKSSKLPKEFSLPEWIDQKTWQEFEEMRHTIKAPMTDRARVLIIADLDTLRHEGQNVIKVLEQSIVSCWRGVFALKNGNGNGANHGKDSRNATERMARLDSIFESSERGDENPLRDVPERQPPSRLRGSFS